MRYGSVCSGIEAATAAWHGLGWEPQWFAEIEPFPSAVLAHHYPTVPNLGDFTKIGADSEPIDLLVGGTPCQSFSVAGKRLGMDDPRGNLAIEFLRLAYRKRARWFLFENVPGLLSSAKGEDFATFLSLATGTFVRRPKGGWKNAGVVRSKSAAHFGVAYRILDAQYFGVAQRRRRVFVIGYFGDWRPAAAVLFERESLSGNPPPRREASQRVAGTIKGGSGERGYPDPSDGNGGGLVGVEFGPGRNGFTEVSPTLDSRSKDGPIRNQLAQPVLTGVGAFGDSARSLTTSSQRIDAETETFVVGTFQNTGHGWWNEGSTATTLRTPAVGGSLEANIVAIGKQVDCENNPQVSPPLLGEGFDGSEDASGRHALIVHENKSGNVTAAENARSLRSGASHSYQFLVDDGHNPLYYSHDYNQDRIYGTEGAVPAHTAEDSNRSRNVYVPASAAVRRLTPRECERLQGFPDDYSAINYKGKPAADGSRYRALGNSMAVPCMKWLGERIEAVRSFLATKEVVA